MFTDTKRLFCQVAVRYWNWNLDILIGSFFLVLYIFLLSTGVFSDETCSDGKAYEPFCKTYRTNDFCKLYPYGMGKHCALTCGFCSKYIRFKQLSTPILVRTFLMKRPIRGTSTSVLSLQTHSHKQAKIRLYSNILDCLTTMKPKEVKPV